MNIPVSFFKCFKFGPENLNRVIQKASQLVTCKYVRLLLLLLFTTGSGRDRACC